MKKSTKTKLTLAALPAKPAKTGAMYGKDSEASKNIYGGITGAGNEALDTWANAERETRERTFAKAAEATA